MAKSTKISGAEFRTDRRARLVAKLHSDKKKKAGTGRAAKIYQFGRFVKSVDPTSGMITIDATTQDRAVKPRVLRFGTVTVSHSGPDADTVRLNVKEGKEALFRTKDVWVKPGVVLPLAAAIPKFRVDAANPKILIRDLNGEIDRGRIVNGTFVTAE